jgi:hypothetical protein
MIRSIWRKLFRRKPWWHDDRIRMGAGWRRDAFNTYDPCRRLP